MLSRRLLHKFSKITHNNLGLFYAKPNLYQLAYATKGDSLDSKQKLQLLSKQSWFEEYQTATKYNSDNLNKDALRSYYKVVQMMQQKNQKGQAYYYKIFQRILKLNITMNRPLQAEQNFYRLIKTKKTLQKNPIFVYEDYQNLMVHLLKHDVQKAIKLGKALLSESQISSLPINIEKNIRMLLGNGYLLTDNLPDAKKKYGQVLQMKPNHLLKGKALNNLAIACWWHKNPVYPSQQKNITYDQLRINRDFQQTKQLLMNSIGSLENIQQMGQKTANLLQNLLNQKAESMLATSNKSSKAEELVYSFQYEQSLKPIYNLIQYYIYNDPIQQSLILAWIKLLLKVSAKFNSANLIDEMTAKYYLLNNNVQQLKKSLKSAVDRCQKQKQSLGGQTNSLDQLDFRILESYRIMNLLDRVQHKGKSQELKTDKRDIQRLEKQLLQRDKFIFKRAFISSEEMTFMKKQHSLL